MANTEQINHHFLILKKILDSYEKILQSQFIQLDETLHTRLKEHLERQEELEDEYKEKFERLTDGEFSRLEIGVVGTFNAGKSTFINSLLGEELLKMDATPSTAKISRIQYGENFELFKKLKNGQFTKVSREEFELISNHNEVQKQEEDDIDHFLINHPSDKLKRFVFVDTPGFSSAAAEDDNLTKKCIPELDLLIWLVSPTLGGLGEDEKEILDDFKDKKKICVFNRIDLRTPKEIKSIEKELTPYFEKVFPYSAKKILSVNKNFTKFEDYFLEFAETAVDCFANNSNFVFQYKDSTLEFCSDACNKIYEFEPFDSRGRYFNYLETFFKFLDELREEVFEIKSGEIESAVGRLIKSEQPTIGSLLRELTALVKNQESRMMIEEQAHRQRKVNLERILSKEYKHLRKELFDRILEHLFEETQVEKGGLFSDTKRGFVSKTMLADDTQKNDVVAIVNERFRQFVDFGFTQFNKEYEFIPESKSTMDRELLYIQHVIKVLSSSVGNSIDVLLHLWKPDKNITVEDQKEKLIELIDKIVPDEELFEGLTNSLDRLSNLHHETQMELAKLSKTVINDIFAQLNAINKEISDLDKYKVSAEADRDEVVPVISQ